MSGQAKTTRRREFGLLERASIVTDVRAASGITEAQFSDTGILGAVAGFVGQFDYWYVRVMREAVEDYRKLIIQRINPFVRAVDCGGLGAQATAERIVRDYDSRNLVTAGGWALEEMAVGFGVAKKVTSTGLDLERYDAKGIRHLYVLKSGPVTRNSDIVSGIKTHLRKARSLDRQSGASSGAVGVYAISAGCSSSTDVDDVRRPSSAEFWSEMTGLPVADALKLVLAVGDEARSWVLRDSSNYVKALTTLVRAYIEDPSNAGVVDWAFVKKRTLSASSEWAEEEAKRHQRALDALKAEGLEIPKAPPPVKESEPAPTKTPKAAAKKKKKGKK